MKKYLLNFALLILAFSASAQDFSTVEGVWEKGKSKNIKLFAIENSNYKEVASSRVDESGRFVIAFYPAKEGIYALNNYNFYFKPGDKLSINITDTSYELKDENTPENIEIARWELLVTPLKEMRRRTQTTYADFFPLLVQTEKEMNYKASTPNKTFNAVFDKYKELNLLDIATNYLFSPRTAHPRKEDFPDYFKKIDLKKMIADPFILNYPNGLSLLGKSKIIPIWTGESKSTEKKKDITASPESGIIDNEELMKVADPMVRAELVLLYAKNKQVLIVFDEYVDMYSKYLVTDEQRQRLAQLRFPLIKNDKGEPATDFAFTDANGKSHALSDFKGKIVYVDVWATWCAPCKKELPHLKKLETEYKNNKDIVFVGVSVDKEKDKQKWKEFLVREELPGIQLFAGDEASEKLMKPYKITGIPRFILVDKNGNLLSANAPRPSSPDVRTVLNDALKK
ncbi:TlpA disulfide reductase family protein [Bacteroides sp. GM023]|uniref:TlpA family protein disulfide reductase n=1 Tax=Bacteroides sp. GM023 TaxID=2723058 RepID=UPI00168AD237|nr:TlpA disulfide reductase family protein [Bacteroides sp. GM023]MBD3591600.1 TlpA family protein disulfide reductase [Bacteroides sp. GM023]